MNVEIAAPPPASRGGHATMIGASLDELPGAPQKEPARTLIDAPLPPPPGAAPLPSSPFAPTPLNKTMLGVSLQPPPGERPDTLPDLPQQPEPAARAPQNRTMLGMPAIDAAAIAAAAQRASAPPAQPASTAAPAALAPPAAAPAAPMPPAAAPMPPAAAPMPPAAAPMPSAAAPMPSAAAPMPPAAAPMPPAAAPMPPAPAPIAPVAAEPAPAASKRAALGPSNRTMLGVVVPTADPARASLPQAPAPAPAAPPAPAYAAPDPLDATGDMSIAGLPSPAKRGRGLLLAMLAIGVLVMLGVVGGLAWWRFGPRDTPIRATVAQGEQGEVLDVEVPGAPEGSRVRFGGAEQPLASGRARLPLSAEALHVGDNPLSIDVVAPDGAVTTHRVTLTLELRVRADLSTLDAAEPAITVVVEALPGSTATLDAQPLALDAQGRGSRAYPIAAITPGADGSLAHQARWTVQPPSGEAAQGTLDTRVPLTTIQIDRPGDQVVTDRDRIEIAGAVPPQATVTIDGQSVPVNDGRFLHVYPLAQVGDATPRIVARAPGRAPATRTITIRRVADLAREAASFEVDRALTYARIAQAPAHFQGQRVALEGRVYNVDVQSGRSVLQMLVRDCPAGQRCPLWVTYPAATEVTVESWVRVLGTVAGEQQFRSESGQVRTVPRVDATYVLPASP
ncbi:DNA polymerase III subunits gamma and tau [Sandaracinus amylolyticus]|uniref:DNA polymerase III subunits gamma and tau n=1 Tax=Sandaracinus amylolyticus TaxID=927083 RepID=A0A0F6W5J0_9BACT|nr:DNA polymerase III subunits gamma and tau [Sandaracinus amylolyticus]